MGGNNDKNYIPEVYTHKGGTQSIDSLSPLLTKGKFFSCKIILNNNSYGSGFFCKILSQKNQIIKVLFTCNHVLTENFLLSNNEIDIEFNNEKRKIVFKDNKRKIWMNEKLDYTCIEILNTDDIKEFLQTDIEIFEESYNKNLSKQEIFLFGYNKDEDENEPKQGFESGIILGYNKKNKQFFANYNSTPGASGGAVLLKKGHKLIGMHGGGSKENVIPKVNIIIPLNIILDDLNSNKHSLYNIKTKNIINTKKNIEDKNKEKEIKKKIENKEIQKNLPVVEKDKKMNNLNPNRIEKVIEKNEIKINETKENNNFIIKRNNNKDENKNEIIENNNNSIIIDKKEEDNNKNKEEKKEYIQLGNLSKKVALEEFNNLIKDVYGFIICKECGEKYTEFEASKLVEVNKNVEAHIFENCKKCGKNNYVTEIPYGLNLICKVCGDKTFKESPLPFGGLDIIFFLKDNSKNCDICGKNDYIVISERIK